MFPYPCLGSSDRLKLGTSEFGHFVENAGSDPGLGFLVWKARGFQFGADDRLPAAHLGFHRAALTVAVADLPGQTPTRAVSR